MFKVIFGIAIGMAIGVGAYTFVYARGYSYMTDNFYLGGLPMKLFSVALQGCFNRSSLD